MDDQNIKTLPGTDVPLPPDNPIEEGIVIPVDVDEASKED